MGTPSIKKGSRISPRLANLHYPKLLLRHAHWPPYIRQDLWRLVNGLVGHVPGAPMDAYRLFGFLLLSASLTNLSVAPKIGFRRLIK